LCDEAQAAPTSAAAAARMRSDAFMTIPFVRLVARTIDRLGKGVPNAGLSVRSWFE
jgi:hypothetical protein